LKKEQEQQRLLEEMERKAKEKYGTIAI